MRALRAHQTIISRTLDNVRFISQHYESIQTQQQVVVVYALPAHTQDIDEWQFVSTVIDRCFLIIYAVLNAAALLIILQVHTSRRLLLYVCRRQPCTTLVSR